MNECDPHRAQIAISIVGVVDSQQWPACPDLFSDLLRAGLIIQFGNYSELIDRWVLVSDS